jgi:hypothetical protein
MMWWWCGNIMTWCSTCIPLPPSSSHIHRRYLVNYQQLSKKIYSVKLCWVRKKAWHKLFRVKWQQSWNAYQARDRRRVCEALAGDISSKRLTLHRVLFKSESALVTHMRTRRIDLADYLFSRRVSIVLSSDCICDYYRQTLKHVLLFCNDRSANKQSMFRDDETTNLRKLLNIEKKLKASVNWLMKINLLTQFSLIKECLK